MYVESLVVHGASGLPGSLRVEGLGADLVLVVGPNGCGKSTVGTAVGAMLWPGAVREDLHVTAQWRVRDGQALGSTLRFGSVGWSDESPRVPKEAESAWSLSIADLLRVDGGTDAAIAREIERALTGGYDLSALRAGFSKSAGGARDVRRRVGEATRELRALLDRSDEMARREDRLSELVRARAEASQASRDLQDASRALELARARAELADVERLEEELPDGLDQVSRDVVEQASRAKTRVGKTGGELADAESKRDQAASVVQRLRFPQAAPDPASVDGAVRGVQSVRDALRDQTAARAELQGARGQVAETARQVLVESAGSAIPTAEDLEQLEAALAGLRTAETELRAARNAADDLAAEPAPAAEEPSLATLRQGIDALRQWLAAPPVSGSEPAPAWVRVVAALGAIAAVGGGLAAGGWGAAPGLLLVGFAGGVLFSGWRSRAAGAADPRGASRAAFARTGLAAPARWGQADVATHLATLEDRLDEAREAGELRRRREAAHRHAERQSTHLEAERAEVAAVVSRLGLNPDFAGTGLAHQASRLARLADARGRLAGAEAVTQEHERALSAGVEALLVWLRSTGLLDDDDGAELTPEEVCVRVDRVRRQAADFEAAEATHVDRERELLAVSERLEADRSELAELYRRAGVEPDDDRSLHHRCGLTDRFDELRAKREAGQQRIATLEQSLSRRPDWLTLEESVAEAEIEALGALADELQDRTEAVAEVEQAVRAASDGTSVQDARSKLDGAHETLADTRDEILSDVAAREVVDWLSNTVSRDHMPAVLERARTWLLRFTRNRYSLEVCGDAQFAAKDMDDSIRRGLSELSDGTRIQLLLSVRLAFLEQAEDGGPRLPLFLDEVLSTTDPERFRAIGRCLLELVADGRQVLYATADPAEVAAWESLCEEVGKPAPRVVVLGAGSGGAWPAELPPAPAPSAPVPAPGTMTAGDYLAALGVGQPSLWAAAGAWHMVHVAYDDLTAAHRCLEADIPTVGRYVTVRASAQLSVPLDPAIIARLDARIALLRACLPLLREGRGRPLDWAVVSGSGAVSSAFEDRVRALVDSHAGSPEDFVAAVDDLPRFRGASVDKLRQALEDAGHIDPRPTLSLDDRVFRARESVAAQCDAGVLDPAEIRPFVAWVSRLVGNPEVEP